MGEKLSWKEIKTRYPEQWVDLVDFEWDELESDPRCGVVRLTSKARKEIHEQFMNDPVDNSVIVYTGAMKIPEGMVFSANLHQYSARK